MGIARNQLVNAGCREDYGFFADADVVSKNDEIPHEEHYGERHHARGVQENRSTTIVSTCKERNASCTEHQQHEADFKLHRYGKRGIIVVGGDYSSLCWYKWLMQETKLCNRRIYIYVCSSRFLRHLGRV